MYKRQGKGGSEVEALRKELNKLTGKRVHIKDVYKRQTLSGVFRPKAEFLEMLGWF